MDHGRIRGAVGFLLFATIFWLLTTPSLTRPTQPVSQADSRLVNVAISQINLTETFQPNTVESQFKLARELWWTRELSSETIPVDTSDHFVELAVRFSESLDNSLRTIQQRQKMQTALIRAELTKVQRLRQPNIVNVRVSAFRTSSVGGRPQPGEEVQYEVTLIELFHDGTAESEIRVVDFNVRRSRSRV